MPHAINRIRHNLKRRSLVVRDVSPLTPMMLRITLEGTDLADFPSASPDDHIKLILPGTGEMRDYTPRRFDREAGTLVVDFALHEVGPATDWARAARPGDSIQIGGPKGSAVITGDIDWWLLIGDETALPAIGRRLEELAAGTRVMTVIAVTDAAEEQAFETGCNLSTVWIHRPAEAKDDPAPVLAALKTMVLPEGDGFVWIAAEAQITRTVRTYVTETMGHPASAIKAAGYWIKGTADSSEKG